ncbi:hypothetical protein EZV62_014437 [Acer yangbiense]|uniref:Phospholipase D n=1 Tax=Acer yangbiense TaxID=1000413 RepID=A0A5C7HSU3_9ROSI|nr:hypothetical protein EZV62_014437 [Acer yangbiense]
MAAADEDKSVKGHVIYLHGDLDLKIMAARRLPNMDVVAKSFRRCFTVCGSCRRPPSKSRSADSASDLEGDGAGDKKVHSHRKIITTHPYVKVVVPQATVALTSVLKNSQNPRWNEHFVIPLAHPVVDLEFQVKDDDVFGAELIGTVKIPASELSTGELFSGWFPIIGANGQPPKPETALKLVMRFTPCEKNPLYRHGIVGDPDQLGVRRTYFPVRKGCQLTLYKDAHVTPELLPEIELENNQVYKQGTCWEDICHAISEAHHLVYIVGWSVFHKIKLIREPTRELPRGGDLTLGELLKYKSEEGVRILLLVWKDKLSLSIDKFGIKTVVGGVFTHHQKFVLVDTQASGNNRKITAFMGGIDLCDGRYDTAEHRLFRDLNTVFEGDFHNPTYPAATTKGPRQPWHDLHCRIDGPAAYDILINFEQRWRRSTRWKEFSLKFKEVSHWKDDSLIKIERISWILCPELSVTRDGTTIVPTDDRVVRVSNENNPENWHVQIFRSIDSGSLKGFPKHIDQIEAQNLLCSKDLVVDKSIQDAYIQAIRSAQHFIYIENQYFLGSSYAWPSYKYAGADNLIPMELALKIANKIRANERFAVYIIIPMWPEGDPKKESVQEILYWQSQTMQMMYSVVAEALKDMQMNSHPQEYLNFYCLGKREEIPKDASATNGATVSDSEKYRRFMIYVHAKGMIVDDEYVIVGSANINQRSMAGTKDTEIAMGAYQPHHTWIKKNKHPYGQVYGYRKSLWAEHLGKLDRCFEVPESSECVKTVNQIADENWTRFTAPEFTLLQGHLLKYPLHIDADGKVGPLQGHENFPDTGGSVIGTHFLNLPDIMTT